VALLFAKRVFQVAGIWGVFILTLAYGAYLLGIEGATIDTDRPELVHGFFLVTLAFQVVFFIIATDPLRYRLMMLAAMLEKFPFTLATLALYSTGQAPSIAAVLGLIDGLLGTLFAIAYLLTDRLAGAQE
jgi:hypothetical protein